MRVIFLSYRREDAEGQAGRLFNDLIRHFGPKAVFMDVAAIDPGRDFRRAIDDHVASCGVLLAVIGKRWLEATDDDGQLRLNNPHDFVRLETAAALKRDIPLIPVLVQSAKMPRAEQLPPDLAELAFRNAVELTHTRWDSDLQVLIKALEAALQTSGSARPWRKKGVPAIAAAVGALAVGVAGFLTYGVVQPGDVPVTPAKIPVIEQPIQSSATPAPATGVKPVSKDKPASADSREPTTRTATPPKTMSTRKPVAKPTTTTGSVAQRSPAPPPPMFIPAPHSMVGVWNGWYRCAQGDTGARLTAYRTPLGAIEGQFDFFPLASNPRVPSGSYIVRVVSSANQTTLVGSRWLIQPPTFAMVDLQGVVSQDGRRFFGRIDAPMCQSFSLERSP